MLISGFKLYRVLLRSDVAYFCFTKAGKRGWSFLSHKRTIKFSRVGDTTSSVVMSSSSWVRLPSALSKLSLMKADIL